MQTFEMASRAQIMLDDFRSHPKKSAQYGRFLFKPRSANRTRSSSRLSDDFQQLLLP
jgi:hypothetical protein